MATYTLTGPGSGVQETASTNFTVTADATVISTPVVVTPNDNGQGGTFTPASVSLTAASQAKTFTYTPRTTGVKSIGSTSTQSYVNPARVNYTVTMNKDVVINQILYANFRNTGKRFPFDEIVRDGGVSNADALTLRSSFETYYNARQSYSTPVVRKPDKAAAIHKTYAKGRVNRGGGDINADKAASIDQVNQTGRSDNGSSTGDSIIHQTNSTGRR